MEDKIGAFNRPAGKVDAGEISFEKLDARNVIEVRTSARDQRIGNPNTVAAPHEFFRQVRTDETGAPRDQVQ